MANDLNSVPQTLIPNHIPVAPVAPATEAPKADNSPKTPTAPDKNDQMTSRFAHLSKKEAAFVKQQESLKKEMDDFKAQRDSHKAEVEKLREVHKFLTDFQELKSKDAVGAMKMAGFSEADILNFMAAQEDTSTPEEKASKIVQAELAKYKEEQKKELEDQKKALEDERKKSDSERILKVKADINSVVEGDKAKYEYCNFYGESAKDIIFETVAASLGTPDQLSLSEAAELVENYFEEQDKSMNSLSKRKPKEAPKLPEAKSESLLDTIQRDKKVSNRVESKQFVNNKPPTKTLSNKVGQTLSSTSPIPVNHEQNKARIVEKYSTLIKR